MIMYSIKLNLTNHLVNKSIIVKIDGEKTLLDYFNKIIDIDELLIKNSYVYRGKVLGFDYPLKNTIYTVFRVDQNPVVEEISFKNSINPIKKLNWLYLINSKNLYDIENLSGIEPINRTIIGGLHQWGVKRDKTINTIANYPENLVIIKHQNRKFAYNRYCLLNSLKLSKKDEFVLPHNKITVSKSFLTNKLHVFREDLPIIDMDSLV